MTNETSRERKRHTASTPSEAIVQEIAERANINAVDLPPLYDYFDPEALDTLIDEQKSCRIIFEYAGYEVDISEMNSLEIHERGSGCSEDTPRR